MSDCQNKEAAESLHNFAFLTLNVFGQSESKFISSI